MTTATTSAATTAGAATSGVAAAPTINADFNLFLKMLTAQMQNQDPLKPMDSTEYTSQLAQYSQVEQTVQQTSTLKDILARFSSQDMSQASSYIGREATFDSPTAGLSNATPASWGYAPIRDASTLVGVISDPTGKQIATMSLNAAGGRLNWDGVLPGGGKATPGSYTLSATAKDYSGNNVPVTLTSIGKVNEVVTDATKGVLLGVNGASMPVTRLKSVAAME